MTDRLHALYRELSARTAAPDAEAIARLAAGERDDDALLAVSGSRAGSDALAVALAGAGDAHALATSLWRTNADARREAARSRGRVPALPVAWLAAAAAIAFGFTVMLKLSAPRELPDAPIATAPAMPGAGEAMMQGSFEEGSVVADSFEAAPAQGEPAPLFSDDFDA